MQTRKDFEDKSQKIHSPKTEKGLNENVKAAHLECKQDKILKTKSQKIHSAKTEKRLNETLKKNRYSLHVMFAL